jgi:membrane fusion protein (multidrug efflux system)
MESDKVSMALLNRAAPLALLLLAACGSSEKEQASAPPTPEVGVLELKLQPATFTSVLPGRTAAIETSEVRPQVNGLIVARLFQEGDMVRKGQPLYRIDPQPYVAQVASARAALTRARAAIASSAALRRRYGELVRINAIAKQDYENAITSAQQAQADVAAQQAALRSAEIDLSRTTIRAPISGRIGRSVFTTGALATSGQADPLTTIQRLDSIYVDVQQSSAELLRLRQQILSGSLSKGGGAARVRLRLEDGSLYDQEGRLQFTDVSVDPTTGSQIIRAIFPNPRNLLLPGMYVRAELIEGTRADALLVPQRTVSRNERGEPTVLVVGRDNKVAQRIITAPRTIGSNWLVTDGLRPGERVIVEGGANVRPGAVVKPKLWRNPATSGNQAPARPAATPAAAAQ